MEDDERRIFERVREKSESRDMIRPVPIGEQLGIHPQRTREFCRKWKNDGLADFADPNRIWLTEKGETINNGKMQEL